MSDYQEGEVLVNPKTGEKIQLVKGEWKPVLVDLQERATKAVVEMPKAEQPTSGGFARGLQLGARDLMTGISGIPALAADVATLPLTNLRNLAVSGYNKVTGSDVPQRPVIGGTQKDFQSLLDFAGYPKPETDTERTLSAVTQGVGGLATGLGGAQALAKSASPVAQRLASVLSAAPRTQLAVSAASPAAGETVRQAGGGPVSQIAAELATAGALSAPSAMLRTGAQTATTDQLRAASSAAYKAAEQAGAIFKPTAYDRFFSSLIPDVQKAGFDVGLHPKAAAVLARLDSEQGKPQTLENMEILRRVVKSAAASPEADERRIASLIQEKLDDFVSNAGPSEIMAGNAPVAVSELQNARKLWSQASKSDTIETLIDRAKLSAPNFSASGMENALRTEFRALAKNERKMRLFSSDEQDAIRKVAMGGPMENVLRMIGKFAPTGVVSGALSSGTGALFGGGIGAVALPAAGFVARQGATALTKRNADMAAALMRGSKIASQPGMSKEKLAAALAAMSAANAGQQ